MTPLLANMRPIALQDVIFQRLATCVLLQPQDALQIVVPAAQAGFMKGRRMLDHIERARLLWDSSDDVNMLLVDFSKAYDSMIQYNTQAYLCGGGGGSRKAKYVCRSPTSDAGINTTGPGGSGPPLHPLWSSGAVGARSGPADSRGPSPEWLLCRADAAGW